MVRDLDGTGSTFRQPLDIRILAKAGQLDAGRLRRIGGSQSDAAAGPRGQQQRGNRRLRGRSGCANWVVDPQRQVGCVRAGGKAAVPGGEGEETRRGAGSAAQPRVDGKARVIREVAAYAG